VEGGETDIRDGHGSLDESCDRHRGGSGGAGGARGVKGAGGAGYCGAQGYRRSRRLLTVIHVVEQLPVIVADDEVHVPIAIPVLPSWRGVSVNVNGLKWVVLARAGRQAAGARLFATEGQDKRQR